MSASACARRECGLRRQLEDCLGLAFERGVKIVVNAGGLNPDGCAEAVRALATRVGVPVTVAAVSGDDVLQRAAELQPPDWEALADFFLATKRHRMETMDLATVPAEFPAEVMAERGSMVGYVEVFPWAQPWDFMLSADWWLADDQYCVRPGCTCTQTALTLFRLPKRTPSWRDKVKPEISLRYDYVSRLTELIEARPRHPAAGELMQTLRAAYPDFGEVLRERHRQLKQLGRRLLRKSRRQTQRASWAQEDVELDAAAESSPLQPPAPETVRAVMRPGRNDPCPCGSGKKFKKCCGAA